MSDGEREPVKGYLLWSIQKQCGQSYCHNEGDRFVILMNEPSTKEFWVDGPVYCGYANSRHDMVGTIELPDDLEDEECGIYVVFRYAGNLLEPGPTCVTFTNLGSHTGMGNYMNHVGDFSSASRFVDKTCKQIQDHGLRSVILPPEKCVNIVGKPTPYSEQFRPDGHPHRLRFVTLFIPIYDTQEEWMYHNCAMSRVVSIKFVG